MITNNLKGNKPTTLSHHLSNSLYQEIVIDGPPSPDKKGVNNFLRVLEWRLDNTISDEEFSHLYTTWVSTVDSTQIGKPTEPLTKKDMRDLLQHKTELELLSMLGLLVREYNYTLLTCGHTSDWCKGIETLFWMLDDDGRGYATQDEMLFLLLAIVGNPAETDNATSGNVALAQQHTFYLMKEFNAKGGLVTLRRFKAYFDQNKLDLPAVQRSINSLSNLLDSIRSLLQDSKHLAVPKIWQQAISQAIDYIQDSFSQFDDVNAWGVIDFLTTDSFEVRFGFTSEKPHWKLSLQLFKEFTLLYGYISPIEYTKDSIFKDQNFVLIQQTLRFYDELLAEILDQLFPAGQSKNFTPSAEDIPTQRESEESPATKLALGEYTSQQVSQWLRNASWVDVTVHEVQLDFSPVQYPSCNVSTISKLLFYTIRLSNKYDKENNDALNEAHNGLEPSKSLPQHKHLNPLLMDSRISIENITPTYLQTIFAQPLINQPQMLQKQNVPQKPLQGTQATRVASRRGPEITSENPEAPIPPVGVVPISKIPHKGTLRGRKKQSY